MNIETVDEPNTFTASDYFSDPAGKINEEMPPQTFVVELREEDGGTTLISRSILASTEQLEQLVSMGMVEGFSSQLNKLEKLLAE